jgi:hypothetical protein
LWWRTWKHQSSKFFPKAQSTAFSPKRAWLGQSGESDATEKEIVWQNSDCRECALQT